MDNAKVRIVDKRLGLSGQNIKFEREDFFGLKVGQSVVQIGNGKENGTIRTDVFKYPVKYVGSIILKFNQLEKMFAFLLPDKIDGDDIYLLYGSTEEEIFTEIEPCFMRFYAPQFITENQ